MGLLGKQVREKLPLLRQLLREYPLDEGQLTIGGVDIAAQTKEQILDWIGYVPQDHVLFSRTIGENILFGKEDATKMDLRKPFALHTLKRI